MQYNIVWENGEGLLRLFANGDGQDLANLLNVSLDNGNQVRPIKLEDLKKALVSENGFFMI